MVHCNRLRTGSSFWFTQTVPSAVRSKNSSPSSYWGSFCTWTKPLDTMTREPAPVTGRPQASTLTTRMCVPLIGVAHWETVETSVHPLRGNAERGERGHMAAPETEEIRPAGQVPDRVLRAVERARERPGEHLRPVAEHRTGAVDPAGTGSSGRPVRPGAGVPEARDHLVPGRGVDGAADGLLLHQPPGHEGRQGRVRDMDDALSAVAARELSLYSTEGDRHILAAGDEGCGGRLETDGRGVVQGGVGGQVRPGGVLVGGAGLARLAGPEGPADDVRLHLEQGFLSPVRQVGLGEAIADRGAVELRINGERRRAPVLLADVAGHGRLSRRGSAGTCDGDALVVDGASAATALDPGDALLPVRVGRRVLSCIPQEVGERNEAGPVNDLPYSSHGSSPPYFASVTRKSTSAGLPVFW